MPDNGNSRIDRIEESLEKLTDVVGKLAGVVTSLAEGQQRLQMAQIETTGKLDALIHIVDEWIRNPAPSRRVVSRFAASRPKFGSIPRLQTFGS